MNYFHGMTTTSLHVPCEDFQNKNCDLLECVSEILVVLLVPDLPCFMFWVDVDLHFIYALLYLVQREKQDVFYWKNNWQIHLLTLFNSTIFSYIHKNLIQFPPFHRNTFAFALPSLYLLLVYWVSAPLTLD